MWVYIILLLPAIVLISGMIGMLIRNQVETEQKDKNHMIKSVLVGLPFFLILAYIVWSMRSCM